MNEQNVFPISSYLKQENQNSKNEKKKTIGVPYSHSFCHKIHAVTTFENCN